VISEPLSKEQGPSVLAYIDDLVEYKDEVNELRQLELSINKPGLARVLLL
jgi:hypothetical protein